jgi:hypothetical protein
VRYLPFNNCLTTARLYNNGLSEDVKFRIYFPNGLFTSADVKLTDLILEVEEDVGSAEDDKKWKDASATTLAYNTVIRQRQQEGITRTIGNKNTIKLNGVNGSSAGIVVYSNSGEKPSPSNAAALTTRYPISELTILDSMSNKRTENLLGPYLRSYVWTEHIQTPYAATVATYLIPFSADFRRAVEAGKNCGSFKLDGTDQLLLSDATANRVESVTITNYCYATIVVSNNKLLSFITKF